MSADVSYRRSSSDGLRPLLPPHHVSKDAAGRKGPDAIEADHLSVAKEEKVVTTNGRTWVKWVVLGGAVVTISALAAASVATLTLGIGLMFFPGLGTAAGAAVSGLGATFAGAVVVVVNFAVANATGIAVLGSLGIAISGVAAGVTSVVWRCFNVTKTSHETSEISKVEIRGEGNPGKKGTAKLKDDVEEPSSRHDSQSAHGDAEGSSSDT